MKPTASEPPPQRPDGLPSFSCPLWRFRNDLIQNRQTKQKKQKNKKNPTVFVVCASRLLLWVTKNTEL